MSPQATLSDEQSELARLFEDGCDRLRIRRLVGMNEFQSLHEPHAAYLAYEGILVLQFFQLAAKIAAHFFRILDQLFFFNVPDDGQRSRRRDRIPAKG